MKKIIVLLNLILSGAISPLAAAVELQTLSQIEESAPMLIARPRIGYRGTIRRPNYPHHNNYHRNKPRIGVVINRTVIVNPGRVGTYAWAWNSGRRWYPKTHYWGGGFWGGFVIGAVTGGIIGAVTSNQGDTYVENNYYRVEQGSPGNTLLLDYELAQTSCNQEQELVVINGPENSQICSFPNDLVTSGVYNVDVSTLTLVADN